MLGEHFQEIRRFFEQERNMAQYYRKPVTWEERDATPRETERVTSLIYEMLEDYATHDQNINDSTIELRRQVLEQGGLWTEIKLFWGKRGFTPQEKYFVQTNMFAKTDIPIEEVPPKIIEKDFHRTPRIDVTPTAVKMTYSPQSVQLLIPEQHLLIKASEESYPTAIVSEKPAIIYPAMARVLANAVHTEMTWRRGSNYWRPVK